MHNTPVINSCAKSKLTCQQLENSGNMTCLLTIVSQPVDWIQERRRMFQSMDLDAKTILLL